MPLPVNLSHVIQAADVIVVATVEDISPDFPVATRADAEPNVVTSMATALALQPAATYKLKRQILIKGDCQKEFEVHLPPISAFYYGWNKFHVGNGTPVLLFLKTQNGQAVPVSTINPVLPIANAVLTTPAGIQPSTKPAHRDAIDVLLPSLHDAALRPVIMHALVDVADRRVAVAVRQYEDEKDIGTRCDALYCLALNQDVTAIPRIAKLAAQMEKSSGDGAGTYALQLYTTHKAIPFLNQLIVDGTDLTRMNAMVALRPIADKSSIPFLMEALERDDSQHTLSYGAYYALHRLVGRSLGPALSRPQFYANKAKEIQILKDWWDWESRKWNPATMPADSAPHE